MTTTVFGAGAHVPRAYLDAAATRAAGQAGPDAVGAQARADYPLLENPVPRAPAGRRVAVTNGGPVARHCR